MSDRENSPAYAALPRSARRVFAAIERAIGDGSSASVSYTDFRLDHHIGRQNISVSLKLLDHLGLIEIEPGPRLVARSRRFLTGLAAKSALMPPARRVRFWPPSSPACRNPR